jgi:hypothetical protein
MTRSTALIVVALATTLSGCAAGLCERRADFFAQQCAGTDVAYSADPYCEQKIEDCTSAQKAQMDAYVSCLESANQCSLAVVARCAEKHPGGVNLACPKR